MDLPRKDILDFICPLCKSLLCEPITSSCGHSYCKVCILHALDHNNKCPVCRTVIHITQNQSVNLVVQGLIQTNFPKEWEMRMREIEQLSKADTGSKLPLFIIDHVLFPNQQLRLHLFEPRHWLMLLHCLEGGRRFCVLSMVGNSLAKVGTTAIIENYVRLPDGQSLVSTRGEKRFKLIDCWDQDGYKIGKVEYFMDESVSDSLSTLLEELRALTQLKLGGVMTEVQEKYGEMPQDPVDFSFWLSALLKVATEQKQLLLEASSVILRLQLARDSLISQKENDIVKVSG